MPQQDAESMNTPWCLAKSVLGGEIRSVVGVDKRIAEAKKLGFTRAITPKQQRNNSFIAVGDVRTALIDYLQE